MFNFSTTKSIVGRLFHARSTPSTARTTRTRLAVEPLEVRDVPAIVWANRGSDDFGTFFGSSANAARAVVDQAIADWNAAVPAFNYDSPLFNNTYNLEILRGRPRIQPGNHRLHIRGSVEPKTRTGADPVGQRWCRCGLVHRPGPRQ